VFDSPGSAKTHPMSDKMRGALFNMLGDIEGLTLLDAFAGSGALSFEAASRGAGSVLAIDFDKAAQKTIDQNIKQLDLARKVKLVKASANAWLSTNQDVTFDIVKPGGLLVLSWPGAEKLPEVEGLELVENRSYGDGQLGFYRR
jgi:16S rRNA (guanine966-N2)-methyltransferase